MTATNHALTGALIGLIVGQPVVAVPAALLSHYVCDALPHFRRNMPDEVLLKSKWFRNYLIVEATLCTVIVLGLAGLRPQHWLLAAICAFIAVSPDLLSINKYLKVRYSRRWSAGRYVKFASDIQWFERPIGAVVEVAWFAAAIVLLLPLLR